MRRLLTLSVLAMVCWAAPSAAQACSFSLDMGMLNDPDQPGISAREKARRETAIRDDLASGIRADQRRWRTEARTGLDEGSEAHALALVETLVPVPVAFSSGICGGFGPSGPDADYSAAQTIVLEAAGKQAGVWREEFSYRYAERIAACNGEMSGRLARYVAARFDPARLAVIWQEVHRLGYDRRGLPGASKLFFFDLDRRLQIWSDRDTNGHGVIWVSRMEDDANREFNLEQWARMSRYLTEDQDALALVALLQQGLAQLGDDTLPYRGQCPETTAGFDSFVADIARRAAPRVPIVQVGAE